MRRNILLISVCLLLGACSKAPEPLRDITLTHKDGSVVSFKVEIADTDAEREYGLMERTDLPPRHGMLFLFPRQDVLTFWMKNTPMFLDIIFIDHTGEIIRVHSKARPFDETPIPSGGPAQYVLEIKGGEAASLQIKRGDKINLPH